MPSQGLSGSDTELKGGQHMQRTLITLVAALLTFSLLLAGCQQAAPAPTAIPAKPAAAAAAPTKAPAAPTAAPTPVPAAAPTKAPTAAPVKKVDWPQKGRTITMIVPYAPGGNTDNGARALAPTLEKVLGIPVQVVNKPGASTQVALTEVANSKPDGYTIGIIANPTSLSTYLDPEFKATYTRKSFAPIANFLSEPASLGVRPESTYKTIKELVDDVKTSGSKYKVGVGGLKSAAHLAGLRFTDTAGIKFTFVKFDGTGPANTALLGGHVDAVVGHGGAMLGPFKSGQMRMLGIMDDKESAYFPGVKTFESQGYKVHAGVSFGFAGPAALEPEVLAVLEKALRESMESDEVKKRAEAMGLTLAFMDHKKYEEHWAAEEPKVQQMLKLADQE